MNARALSRGASTRSSSMRAAAAASASSSVAKRSRSTLARARTFIRHCAAMRGGTLRGERKLGDELLEPALVAGVQAPRDRREQPVGRDVVAEQHGGEALDAP